MVETEHETNYSLKSSLARYFLHGIAFSALLIALGIAWILILAVLVTTGAIIGLILGVIVLFFIIGGINTFLTDAIWNVTMRQDWKGILTHGFVLFIVLILAGIPSFAINLAFPNWTTQAVLFIPYCFIDGYVAKTVASNWESEDQEEQQSPSPIVD